MDPQTVIDATRRWISSVVIGLNLCPFARKPFQMEKVRYSVSAATEAAALYDELAAELNFLTATPRQQVETTLLIHPYTLGDFLDFNDFLGVAENLVKRLGLRGVIQLASFHPQYQFAGTDPDAVENYTNRSPYPMLHLLREISITEVADQLDEAELLAIPQRNIEQLRHLGIKQMRKLLEETAGF